MVTLVDCHARDLGWNPVEPERIPWNCFNGFRSYSVMPESASGSGSGLYSVVCLLEWLIPGS